MILVSRTTPGSPAHTVGTQKGIFRLVTIFTFAAQLQRIAKPDFRRTKKVIGDSS